MITFNKIANCLSEVIGWQEKNYTLDADLLESTSGVYMNSMHPALNLDYIKGGLLPNQNLSEYLRDTKNASIITAMTDVYNRRVLDRGFKELLNNQPLYVNKGNVFNIEPKSNRFVGFSFSTASFVGIKSIINRLSLQTTHAQHNLDIYVYHSSQKEPLRIIKYSTPSNGTETVVNIELEFDDLHRIGGYFYVGYYEEDLYGNAINNVTINWGTGACGSCGGGHFAAAYNNVKGSLSLFAFYVPNGDLNPDKELFDTRQIIMSNDKNFGFNFSFSSGCDLTTFWCDNKNILANVIQLKYQEILLNNLVYSTQVNSITEDLKSTIVWELEGDVKTGRKGILRKYDDAIKTLNLNTSGINPMCLKEIPRQTISYTAVL